MTTIPTMFAPTPALVADYDDAPPANATGATTAAQIDAMVAQSAPQAVVNSAGAIPRDTSGSLRVNTGTGEVTVLAPPTALSGRIYDAPDLDPVREVSTVTANLNRVSAELSATKFDPLTGAQSPRVDGEQRRILELQSNSLQRAHDFALRQSVALFHQRQADETARQARLNEEAARHAFTKGDPAREKALADALLQEEAAQRARDIIAQRRRG